jgi:hypothetical protein
MNFYGFWASKKPHELLWILRGQKTPWDFMGEEKRKGLTVYARGYNVVSRSRAVKPHAPPRAEGDGT